MQKICDWCNERYETNWGAARFCCNDHRVKAWRAEQKEKPKTAGDLKVCPFCHNTFLPERRDQRHCCKAHKQADYRRNKKQKAEMEEWLAAQPKYSGSVDELYASLRWEIGVEPD